MRSKYEDISLSSFELQERIHGCIQFSLVECGDQGRSGNVPRSGRQQLAMPHVHETTFFSFALVPLESWWRRQAHSGRCINSELARDAERILGKWLCYNQFSSPDNQVGQIVPLILGALCGTK